jgi:arylsulfatase B
MLLLPGSILAAGSKPNVVIVITDDQGYGDLACHGNPVLKTPALDQLYTESLRLVDYHVAPTCSPTRAALLTGHWSNRTGVWHTIMGRSMLRERETTMADLFRAGGYATGMFGKWHLGDNVPFRPEDRGFDEVLRHGGGGVGQTPDYWDNAYFNGSYWHNGAPQPVQGFCTDVFFDYAKRFIKTQHAAGTPFLAYIATNAPHGPMHCPPEFSRPYASQGPQVANFFGMIANIDHNVDRLRQFLAEEGLADNTILIFTTDNGTSSGAKVFNAGMRGTKGSPYDGGHRVPFFIHWPAGNLSQGRDLPLLSAHVDVLPTLLEMCGLETPPDLQFDGVSLASVLSGDPSSDWPDRILVTDSQRVKDPIKWRSSAVMTSRWRLINRKQLYDMRVDPSQTSDVASQHPAVVRRLSEFYEAWWHELEPTFAEPAAILLGDERENPVRLTAHDWITSEMTPWNQSHIRGAFHGPANTGYWNVHVVTDGNYEIRLRRWPEETDLAIDSALPPGEPVPGEKAFRETPGVSIAPGNTPITAAISIGGVHQTSVTNPGAQEARFTAQLKAGQTQFSATFTNIDGQIYGAYYAYVSRESL